MRRLLKILAVVLVLLVAVALAAREALDAPLPAAVPGPDGDALAHQLEKAVNREAWERTGAVMWTMAGKNHHLWDRVRQLDRVRWDDVEVWVDLSTQQGVAKVDGEPVGGRRADRLVKKAYAAWINDSFWLNPAVKVFDQGTTRAVVPLGGEDAGHQGLLLQYASGGLTPGDAYLWILDRDGLPVAWRMWVSVIPIGGVRATWVGWTELATGAKISTSHTFGPIDIVISELAGAATLGELVVGPDPFAPLVGGAAPG